MLKLVPSTPLSAAVYARYSSDGQDPSIERQYAGLEKGAARLGLQLRKPFYNDQAKTGTTLFNRPGLTRDLFGAAERGLFDVIFVEHTDRLAREPADMFQIRRQLRFYRGPQGEPVKIYSLAANGEVDELRATFEGYRTHKTVRKPASACDAVIMRRRGIRNTFAALRLTAKKKFCISRARRPRTLKK